MTRRRRVSAALLVPLALATLVAAATIAGGAPRRAVRAGAVAVVESHQPEFALTPAKRQPGDPASFLVVAVLAAVLGVMAPAVGAGRAAGLRAGVLPPERRRALRPRGPPLLLSR